MHWPTSIVSSLDLGASLDDIRETLTQTEEKSKNVLLLHLTADLTWRLGGIRITSCKSAKDRTSMSITLEQVRLLQKYHDLGDDENVEVSMNQNTTLSTDSKVKKKKQTKMENSFNYLDSGMTKSKVLHDAINVMRSHGVRRENALKNTGKDKFCFSRLQQSFLPLEYIPPLGTGGGRYS